MIEEITEMYIVVATSIQNSNKFINERNIWNIYNKISNTHTYNNLAE